MNKLKRILSTLLAVTMLLGTLSALALIEVGAEGPSNPQKTVPIADYPKTKYDTAEDKVNATMTLMSKNQKFELYVDEQSGEVALKEIATGNYLLSNPYDVASDTVSRSEKKKAELLSQILITFTDPNNNNKQDTINSYTDAAMRDQLNVQKIKKGVRVEYTIGRDETRKLVPQVIMADSFEENILIPIREAYEKGLISEFELERFENTWGGKPIDVNTMKLSVRQAMCIEYPFLEEYKTERKDADGKVVTDHRGNVVYDYPLFYVINENVSGIDLLERETFIKTYTSYTFDQMDIDHEITGQEQENVTNPVFKLALEYYLEDDGLTVRLPCNGLRYDMSAYTLENISVLPFMGAGSNHNAGFVYNDGTSLVKTEGYTFFPDGAGAIFDYEENLVGNLSVPGRIYGEDYAYRKLSGYNPMQKAIRFPVYGAVSSEVIHEYSYVKDGVEYEEKISNTVKRTEEILADIAKLEEEGATILSQSVGENATVYHRGYIAMIEEADSLADLRLDNGSNNIGYTTVYNSFNPKPKDSYNLSDAISVASSSTVTEVSERKYTGSIRIHYSMLCDENRAEAALKEDSKYTFFDTSWFGMAEAYRTRLTKTGVLKRLTDKNVTKDIPLYIEVFGALETQQTVATIPVNMMTPLTTFENVKTMYDELSGEGIKNINFKMTGFANGGMYATVPSSLKWENAVGGKDGFKALIQQAKDINKNADANLGLYPDFDFAYIHVDTLFDAVNLQDDAVKSIDNRYASYRQYSATQQTFVSFYQLAMTPASYEKLYTKLIENYGEYELKSLSAASLGTALNSNFNEDLPLNREDSKDYTAEAFAYMKNEGYSLMTDGGNVYTLRYIDHILNADLDSSRHLQAMATVPFVGVVLHGSKQFTGTPLNEEGDARYALLRAIENGASLQFILSYQNTNELKKDPYLSQYYSIQYQIWKDDVVSYYNELNGLLKDVQTSLIVDHKFLVGERVLETEELEAIIAEKLEEAARLEDIALKEKMTAELVAIAEAWTLAYNADSTMQTLRGKLLEAKAELDAIGSIDEYFDFSKEIPAVLTAMKALDAFYAANKEMAEAEEKSEEYLKNEAALVTALDEAKEALNLKLKALRDCTETFVKLEAKIDALYAEMDDIVASLEDSVELVTNTSLYDDNQENRDVILEQIAEGRAVVDSYLESLKAVFAKADFEYMASVATRALTTLDNEFVKAFEEGGAYVGSKKYAEEFKKAFSAMLFDEEDIKAMVPTEENEEDAIEEETTEEDSFYRVDNKKIVLVSYGSTDGRGKDTLKKSFILNYNTFMVRVEYNGIGYSIPSGSYVEIPHVKN